MKKKNLFIVFVLMTSLIFLSTFFASAWTNAKNKPKNPSSISTVPFTIEQFISLATQNDTYFEEILFEALKLAYRKDLALPARDLILSVKGQYNMLLDPRREDPELRISLAKLFPYLGTEIEASYESALPFASRLRASEFNLVISQPIAQNAFGSATRLLDKIVGLENDVLRYQIVEAYEDYLASLVALYYTWYSAFENLKIGQASYEQNVQLFNDMKERSQSKIALPVDVNKVRLLVIDKEENLLTLEQQYSTISQLIYKAIRHDNPQELMPQDPSAFHSFNVNFETDYQQFVQNSRTYKILNLLEEKSSLEVKKNANALLPSTNLLFGYKTRGDDWEIRNNDQLVYAGLSLLWPFGNQVERAKLETSKIEDRRVNLSHQNKYLQLYVDLRNLSLQIEKEKSLIDLAEETIELSESILVDEAKNYSYGKITLNDYIQAVNRVDQSKFNKILYTVQLKKLLLEWLRMTDRLVTEDVLKQTLP